MQKNYKNSLQHTESAHPEDFYATEPRAVEELCDAEEFAPNIWEPACGMGHISKVLESRGYNVKSSDIVDRGFGQIQDFLDDKLGIFDGDIITNPPFSLANEFCLQALNLIPPGRKVAMFLRLNFLSAKKRRPLFEKYPPKTVYTFYSRPRCGKNGVFQGCSMVEYVWVVWQKGYAGQTTLKWLP